MDMEATSKEVPVEAVAVATQHLLTAVSGGIFAPTLYGTRGRWRASGLC